MLAEDRLTDAQISDRLEISRRTLAYWKEHPDFEARVTQHVETFAKRALSRGIARRDRRVDALQDRWERMRALLDARAEEHADVSGGATGLLVRTVKGIGSKSDFREVEEYAFDAALLRELREHEKQAAQELGQWAERQEVTGKNGGPIEVTTLTEEQRLARLNSLLGRGEERAAAGVDA